MKKYSSYFLLTHQSHLLLLLCVYPFSILAKPNYVFQSEDPIANFAWDENDTSRYEGHYRYEQAYKMIEDMLSDKRPLDFAEAVFAVENCMYDGQLNHSAYLAEIERIASGVQRMALSPAVSAPTPDIALNYAIYLFYTQACPLNNYHPFEYDKMSLIEDVGLTGGMVTNLLKTGMGTCHSLPYLYKIIADKVGAKAYIALAPLHLYIRHQDAEGKWWNYETTTGTYSRSSFIMESFHVNENAIRSGLYMTNLTNKETVVQCLFDLLCVYERKTGFYSNDFVRKCYTLGLQYHYADNLHSRRIGDLEYQMKKKAWNKGFRSIAELRNDPVFGREYDYIQQQLAAYEEMGFYAYTQEEYMQKYQEALNYNRTPSDDIRKWLSVDPLADKYPNISPYAYCGWNPIRYVDPDGRDVWELDNSGSIVNIITDETQDAFRMNGKQISFEYGSVTNTYQNEYQTTFTFGNEDAAANAFKFMADNSGVEYGLVNSSQNSTIITQHLESKVNVNGIIDVAVENNEVIKSVIHNHPKNFGPSGFFDGTGDGPTLQTIEKQLGYQIAAYIYLPKTSRLWMYTAQDRNVGISDWSINYPMVGTQSNQTPSWMFKVKNFFGL